MSKKAATAPGLSLALRRYLYGTAAVTGGVIMIVEILGAKMLAPFVGTSHFVWTAQIAVTLVALAAGYYLGGKLVDRSPALGRIYAGILAAAVYLCLTVLMVESVAYWCLRYRLAMGALLASSFLFFPPLCLLAMVGPFFVRMITDTVGGVGGNMGRLTAVSTLGSFAGTILIGYVLIPFLPNSVTMYLTAGLLMMVALVYFMIWSRRTAAGVLVLMVAALTVGYGGVQRETHPTWETVDELEFRNSDFGTLQVLQDKEGPRRWYLNDYLTQNTYDVEAKQSLSMFTYMLHELPRAYVSNIQDVLCIGMGVGIVPMSFAREGARVDVVEINPAVVEVARKYFDCEPDRFGLVVGDGRFFVNRSRKKYDAIVLDAFLGDSSPSHLFSLEAFQGMDRLLRREGVLVINCFGDFERGRDFFVASLNKTLKEVFRSVRIHNSHNGGNVFFVASPAEQLKTYRLPDWESIHPSARGGVRVAFNREVAANPDHGRVLTDDYNPVEYYDAGNRERFRRELVELIRSF